MSNNPVAAALSTGEYRPTPPQAPTDERGA